MSRLIVIDDVPMTDAAAEVVDEAGVDVQTDVDAHVCGMQTEAGLLALCLDGADEDRAQGWRDYVAAVVAYARKFERPRRHSNG